MVVEIPLRCHHDAKGSQRDFEHFLGCRLPTRASDAYNLSLELFPVPLSNTLKSPFCVLDRDYRDTLSLACCEFRCSLI